MTEARTTAAAAAGRMADAIAGVLRRHVAGRPTPHVDPWLLEDVADLLGRALDRATDADHREALVRLRERVARRREEAVPLHACPPAALAARLDQQRTWYGTSCVGRPYATRRPAQLARLAGAMDALLTEVERRGAEVPRLVSVAPRLRQLETSMRADLDAATAARAELSPRSLAVRLREEASRLRREAALLLDSATPGDDAVAAAGRWLDRAFELEAQWLACSFALPSNRRFVAWSRHQNLSFRVRRTLVLP